MVPPPTSSTRLLDIPTALTSSGSVSVVGVVVDVFGGVWKSKGSSSCITFTIKDSDLNNGHTWDGLKIKYFKDDESQLPPVQNGDVILLRGIWLRQFNGKPLGVVAQDRNAPWAIFRHHADPTATATPLCGPVPFELTHPETRRCRALLEQMAGTKKFRDETTPTVVPSASYNALESTSISTPRSRPRGQREFSLIKDIRRPGTFVDIVCEIIKVDTRDSYKTLAYVTDYTSNRKLRTYASEDGVGLEGDQYNYQSWKTTWPGPSGQMTLPVLLWEPHASYARDLLKGEFVQLTNVRIKEYDSKFEGVIHTDQDNIHIELVDAASNDRAKELLRRKEVYWKQNPKRKAAEEARSASKAKKPRNKQRKPAEERREEGQHPLVLKKQPSVNQNDGISYRLPFQNLSYRSTVRVVDFFPPKLEDFAVPEDSSNDRRWLNERPIRWEWRFCLLVESATSPPAGQPRERMKLYVDNNSAQCLLSLDACDLRSNNGVLKDLREKLFILWGDLEEKKTQAAEKCEQDHQRKIGPVSSLAFDCCIQEYGVVCGHRASVNDFDEDEAECTQDDCFGWEQRYAMFQTTIHS
ncbi:telomere-binding alpha subunit central domain protein [Aspergillus terreus]|uniref:Protection of telomeres protein 1 n=1 Tax=Aspergillus terreus TaxID=33178 RepID=A0A5M3YVS4_ASPTE|nr:hypothetical protein ATETN484_0004043000 [Aspergillus terreus]GFF13319.1 telomere-binding alpha subunit central domain protein [Aspergillus terreus]